MSDQSIWKQTLDHWHTTPNGKLMWKCSTCGVERLTTAKNIYDRVKKQNNLNPINECRSCNTILHRSGQNNSNWQGGRRIVGGYMYLNKYAVEGGYWYLCDKRNYMAEHRYVMAKYLGRRIESWEDVHHINGVKLDNRVENLEVVNYQTHTLITRLTAELKEARKRIAELESK